jgi:hypothetical protein
MGLGYSINEGGGTRTIVQGERGRGREGDREMRRDDIDASSNHIRLDETI